MPSDRRTNNRSSLGGGGIDDLCCGRSTRFTSVSACPPILPTPPSRCEGKGLKLTLTRSHMSLRVKRPMWDLAGHVSNRKRKRELGEDGQRSQQEPAQGIALPALRAGAPGRLPHRRGVTPTLYSRVQRVGTPGVRPRGVRGIIRRVLRVAPQDSITFVSTQGNSACAIVYGRGTLC